ncbi:MAG: methionyl-tRNA formyltransferase [Lachnospiraceae bacterium]|nr:methionyl-tRNA formyltransferase [Lachnospiraceae bacterium]
MRIVYMGTPQIAAVILKDMVEAGDGIVAVVTQPDKPKGRGYGMAFSPVKQTALEYGLEIYQPEKVKDEEFLAEMERLAPDLVVVAAFGQILPKYFLDIPKYGCINVHASLLPKYRGAAPIQYAVLDGEPISGVTIQYMAEGIDTGDMITKEVVPLAPDETGGSLHDKLAAAGCAALRRALLQIEAGTVVRTPQEGEQASYVGMIKKEMGRLDFSQPAIQIERRVRAFDPWPGTYTGLAGKNLKFWRCGVTGISSKELQRAKENAWGHGSVIRVDRDSFTVLTGDGGLLVWEVQLEGKRRMTTEEFLRGYTLLEGTFLK